MGAPAGRVAGPRLGWRRWFERVLAGVVAALVSALVLVVLLGVASRKAGRAFVWYDEAASILLAWLTYYGAALVALRRGHIGVPTLVDSLRGRARATVVIGGEVAVVGFFALLAWAGWQVQHALAGTMLVSMPAVPAALAQSVIPIGAALFVAAQLASLPGVLSGASSATEGAVAPATDDSGRPGQRVSG